MSPASLVLLTDVALLLSAWWLAAMQREAAALATLYAAGMVVVWQLILFSTIPRANRNLRIEANIRAPHYVQLAMHSCLYWYWGLYWNEVWPQMPLILTQILFAYGFGMLLSWSRHGVYKLGFGEIPIVFSTNLFLWFHDSYFILQYALVAFMVLSKEFITWKWNGRQRHIFNPSAGALTVASILLIATNQVGISRAVDIVGSFELPPNYLEVIFLVGLVVQVLFKTTWVTCGAVLALEVLHQLGLWVMGAPLGPTSVDPAVFLGTTLLVTDPATSPSTRTGKFLFGIAYGAGVFFLCIVLRLMHQPGVFDKMLVVPVVNLMAPWIDRVAGRCVAGWGALASWASGEFGTRWLPVFVYSGLFLSILPGLKTHDYRPSPLPPPSVQFSPSVALKLLKCDSIRRTVPAVFMPFGFVAEAAESKSIRDFYNQDPYRHQHSGR